MYGIFAGVILSMSVAGWLYFDTTQTELTELRARLAAYELKFATQEEALESVRKDFELQTVALNEVQAASVEIQQEMNRYLDIFKRHNLTKLAAAKPGLIETRANKATKEVFDGIENDSASLDSLDDGVQLALSTSTGSEDSNETSGKADSTADTTKSN